MTELIQGKKVIVNQSPSALYTALSDTTRIADMLPAFLPKMGRDRISLSEDTVQAKVVGFNLGVRICNRTPYSKVEYERCSGPFPFFITVFIDPAPNSASSFHIEFTAELNRMERLVLGRKLREGVDKITDDIAAYYQ